MAIDLIDRVHMEMQIARVSKPGVSFTPGLNPGITREIKMKARAKYSLKDLEKKNIEDSIMS